VRLTELKLTCPSTVAVIAAVVVLVACGEMVITAVHSMLLVQLMPSKLVKPVTAVLKPVRMPVSS
jgi:hypothetical protein